MLSGCAPPIEDGIRALIQKRRRKFLLSLHRVPQEGAHVYVRIKGLHQNPAKSNLDLEFHSLQI